MLSVLWPLSIENNEKVDNVIDVILIIERVIVSKGIDDNHLEASAQKIWVSVLSLVFHFITLFFFQEDDLSSFLEE